MTRYTTHRHKRPGSESSDSTRQLVTDGGISDLSDIDCPEADHSASRSHSESDDDPPGPTPRADGGTDEDPDPPATTEDKPDDESTDSTPEAESDDPSTDNPSSDVDDPSEAWKDTNYPRRPTWAPDCPSCGGPVINVTIAGPGVSQVSPCGCNVAPSDLEIL